LAYLIDPLLEKAKVLADYAKGQDELRKEVVEIIEQVASVPSRAPKLFSGPFQSEEEVIASIIDAGKVIVDIGLVSSVFGNISVGCNDTLYISSTGSQLDNLGSSIAVCEIIGGASKNELKPSSELPTHLRLYRETSAKCIIHGHPFFTVAMSLISGVGGTLFGIPIVGGEVGGGEDGIVHTVPEQLKNLNVVVVCGHGVFAVDSFDFNNPLNAMHKLEKLSKKRYLSEYLA